jgi:hypothetical protein
VQETISLYLQLERGKKADFEIVGRTATAFAEAVKEIAYILEPGIDVRLEFDSGTEGSLSLNAIVKSLGTSKDRRTALIAVIAAVASTLASDIVSYGVGKFLDQFFTQEQRGELSDDDVKRIARAVKDTLDGKVAKEPVREIFRQVERDEAIKSIGATPAPDTKPLRPIPRSDFPERAGIVQRIETSPRTRKSPTRERLTLISPVLLRSDRIWRFRSMLGEFGYHIKDQAFLKSLLSGRRKMTMKEGIQITAVIETHEAFERGVWVPKERYIVKVVTVHRPPKTADLFAQPKKGQTRKK